MCFYVVQQSLISLKADKSARVAFPERVVRAGCPGERTRVPRSEETRLPSSRPFQVENLLAILLHHNVPRFIAHIAKRGVSEEEWNWLRSEDETPDCLYGILMRADEYLLFPKNEKIFEQGLFALVKGLAIMSFVPGGVKFLGLHFCSNIDNFVTIEHEV